MDVTHTKVRRQRRRGVYRLPIAAAASKWLCQVKSESERNPPAQSQTRRRRRGKREVAAPPEDHAGMLMAAAAADGPGSGWEGGGGGGGGGLCDDAFKQFVHECEEDIRGSNGDRHSEQRSPAQFHVGNSNGCENDKLGLGSDFVEDSQETERDSVLGLSTVKLEGCEEFLKVPEADFVSDFTDLRYDPDLQLSGEEVAGGVEPEQNGETVLNDFGLKKGRSVADPAERTTTCEHFTRNNTIFTMPLTQMYHDDPGQSQKRDDFKTELISEEKESTFNVAQLYECCNEDFAQEICLRTAEDHKDVNADQTQETASWSKSVDLELNCNLENVTARQTSSMFNVSNMADNTVEQFFPVIKVEDTKPTSEEMQILQDYALLEEDEGEGEVVLTLTVGAGGQLVPAAGLSGVQLPPDLAAQLALSACASTAADCSAAVPRGAGGGAPLRAEESPPLLSDADLRLAGEAIQEELDGISCPDTPPKATAAGWLRQLQRREDRLHFGDVEEALAAIESDDPARRQRRQRQQQPQHTPPGRPAAPPVKTGPGVHKEVERAARALFSKRTRTLYHWMYPGTPKRKLKATVATAWDTLPESEKLFYMSQVMGRFGTPASNLMVNPQLVGLSADQLEAECAVAGLLAAEAAAAETVAEETSCDGDPCRPARKRTALAALPAFHGKRHCTAQGQPSFSDIDLDPCKQDMDDEISTAELFAPLGI